MTQEQSLEELKSQLQELIGRSKALEAISEQERNGRIEAMMAGTPEDITQYIKVFEDELKENQQVEELFNSEAGDDLLEEDKSLSAEEKNKKFTEERIKRQKIETKLKIQDDKIAENLIKKIEKIKVEGESKKGKSKIQGQPKKEFKSSWLKIVISGFIGLLGCGLSGILIVFGIILFKNEYTKLDIVFNQNPYIAFHAYWVTLVFGALIGLFAIPFLRLIKKRGYFISAIIGLIIGGLIVGISHMAFGLNYDIEIVQNAKSIGVRGYWVAAGFAFIIGIFAQIIIRIMNKSAYFNPEKKKK